MKLHSLRRSIAATVLSVLTGCALNANAQTLTHRYSFDDALGSSTFGDSVGGAAWDGTTVGNATIENSSLVLDGAGSYGSIPTGLINGYNQLTVEFWVDVDASNLAWTRVFSFGDQNGSAKNSGVDYCPFAGGNYQNLDLSDATNDAYANNPAGILGATNLHVTCVFDPTGNRMYYYNGTAVATTGGSAPPYGAAVLVPLSDTTDQFNLLGRSLYDVDPYLVGSIHEFRVYNGVLSRAAVALNEAAGPDSYITSPGTITAIHVSSPISSLVVNQSQPLTVTGDFTGVSNLDLTLYGGATYTPGNSSIVTVSTNGVVKAVGPGSTTVVTSAGSVKATNTFVVVSLPPTLIHRYSFTGNANDSVGGANGTLMGNATISGGKVVLDGSDSTYVDLPGGLINIATNASVTFEAWVNFGQVSPWSRLFEFGNSVGGNGANSIYCAPAVNDGFDEFGISENFGGGQTISWAHGWANLNLHVTCVVDPINSAIVIYTNGVAMAARYDASASLLNVATNLAYLGKSTYNDPYGVESIDEFRIYTGALSPGQIARTDLSGPDSTNSDPGALVSVNVVATNYPSYAAMIAPVILLNYANVSNVNLMPNATVQPTGLLVTSSDTNIITVGANNILTTHQSGSVTLTATYGGKTGSATVTVRNRGVLAHRYSFTTDASDSVGGANGTLNGSLTVSGGQLQLDGISGDYLSLPGGLLNKDNSATIDIWVTMGAGTTWARLWEFADSTNAGPANEFFLAPQWDNPSIHNLLSAGFPFGGGFMIHNGPLVDETLHVTSMVGDGSLDIYTNGVWYGSISNVPAPASQSGATDSWIGHSPFGADPGINGSVDEYRIYDGRLTPLQIQASDILGPNAVLATNASVTISTSGNNIVLTEPLAAAGFVPQMKTSLNPGVPWTTITNTPAIVGSTLQYTIPKGATNQFYRLSE